MKSLAEIIARIIIGLIVGLFFATVIFILIGLMYSEGMI